MFSRSHARQTVGGRARWAVCGAVLAIGVSGAVQVATAVDPPPTSTGFHPITPCRLFDTRTAPNTVGSRNTPLAAAETITVQVTGTNGNCVLPAGIDAVAMNVTVIEGTAQSFLTIWPADVVSKPVASNLNWRAGDGATPNKVDVKVSASGALNMFNKAGTVNVFADVVGYYTDIVGPVAQECLPPFLQVGVDDVGDIVCNNPTDDDGDGFMDDPWKTADPPLTEEDCDDGDPEINPDATEVPLNTFDENCDGADFTVDECEDGDPYTVDAIVDGECANTPTPIDSDGDGYVADVPTGGDPDCDDLTTAINPGAAEIGGNQVDENCDGVLITIEECDDGSPYTDDQIAGGACVNIAISVDADGDGSIAEMAVGGSPDCDDTDDAIYPEATEIPDNGIDDNCNAIIDET